MRRPLTVLASTVAALTVTASCSSDPADDPTSAPAPPSAPSSTATSSSSAASPTDSTSAGSTSGRAKKPTTKPVPSSPVSTVTVDGDKASYVVQVWAQVRNDRCYDHAHGQPVVTYLTTHPCRGLVRILATTVVGGRTVGLAQSKFSFSGAAPGVYKTAGGFRTLVDKDGTGNVDDLFRDGYRLPSGPTSVPSDNAFSALSQDSAVTVLEAWYTEGDTKVNDPTLLRLAKDLFLHL